MIFFSFSKATFLLPQNVLTHHPRTIFLQPSFFAINVLTHYIYIQKRVFFSFKECPHSPSYYCFSTLKNILTHYHNFYFCFFSIACLLIRVVNVLLLLKWLFFHNNNKIKITKKKKTIKTEKKTTVTIPRSTELAEPLVCICPHSPSQFLFFLT